MEFALLRETFARFVKEIALNFEKFYKLQES